MEQVVDFGLLTLVPPIVIIVFALITKRTFEALIIGATLGFLMSAKTGVLSALLDGLMTVVAENAWMWLTLGLFGSFVLLLEKSKGALGFGEAVIKFANGPKKSLIISWILGIIIFMDDYLNILTVSVSMKDVCDKHKTPREMLAYVIDSTGAPVCVLVPISTWAIFFSGVFQSQPEIAALGTGTGFYYSAIPYMFYAWAAVLIVPMVVVGIIPKVFGMKKAYDRVDTTGMVYSEASRKYNEVSLEEQKEAKGRIINFLLPIILLIIIAIYTMDLLYALVIALIVQLILYIATKTIKFGDYCDFFAKGFANMIPMLFICVGALTVKISMDSIALPAYIINAVLPYMSPGLFPAITFIVVAGLSFITGSNWGIPAVTVPILAPLAILSGASLPMTLGAIVSGGTFGSHACFYSDATVLTSQACGIENLEHAFTQIPYAVIGAIIAIVLYVVCGLAL